MSDLKIKSKEAIEKLRVPAEAIIDILREYGDPYTIIVIDQNSAKITVDEACFISKEPLN